MELFHISLLVHILGIGVLCAALFGGLVLHLQYRHAQDASTRLVVLRSLRLVGLLSPLAVVLLLGSGGLNMSLQRYGLFSTGWLSTKLLLVLFLLILGGLSSVFGAKRSRLVTKLADEPAVGEETSRVVRSFDARLLLLYAIQFILLVAIILLSIVKPT